MTLERESPTPSSIRVLAAVAQRDDTYLVCQRPLNKRHGGLWEFPGGKCEPGETDDQAMARELDEELGVRVLQVGSPVFEVRDPQSPFLIAFLPVTLMGEPSCIEHIALRWEPLARLSKLALAPSDRLFVEHFLSSLRSHS